MKIPRAKYIFRFLIKLDWTGKILKLNKFGPILNQLALEDSARIDETVLYYYENQRWPENLNVNLFGRLDFVVWRRQAPYSNFLLKPVNLDSVLKTWLDEREEKGGPAEDVSALFRGFRKFKKKQITLAGRTLLLLCSLKDYRWSPEFSYRLNLQQAIKSFAAVSGTLHTYRRRKEMLGRKINFRRKLKKNNFEDY